MKYKNVICIYANVYLITVTYGTHIGQEKDQEQSAAKPKNIEDIKTDLLSKNVDDQDGSTVEEGLLSLKGEAVDEDAFDEDEDNSQYEDEINQENDVSDGLSPKPLIYKFSDERDIDISKELKPKNSSCWMTLNAKSLFNTMDELDKRYNDTRQSVQEAVINGKFNDKMLKAMLSTGGAAIKEMYRAQQRRRLIPAGLNLGGHCMMRMPNSVIFFHRMKLRNETRFRINYLDNDLANMVLTARLSLYDLHLRGAFERCVTDPDPSVLYYSPSFGEMDLLLKDVEYKMEGRYRLIKGRLVIGVLISEIQVTDILIAYLNKAVGNPTVRVDKANIEEFLDRMKTDLDKWLRDYFNNFLIYTKLDGIPQLDKLEKYDKDKAIALNEYMDNALELIRARLRERTASAAIRIPKFTLLGHDDFNLTIQNGVLRGLDSIYRRSVATSNKQNNIRKVDSLVGFSDLKVTYQYEAFIPTGLPPVTGELTLSANELAAHLSLGMVQNPESVDIDIDFLDQTRPESLTVEGMANLMISNFKHLLQHQIIAIMSNTLVHGIKTLKYLPKCEPFLPGQIVSGNPTETGTTESQARIVGGSSTTIDKYPALVGVLASEDLQTYLHVCGGSILTATAVLTAAHCLIDNPVQFRIRAGSTYANSGGTVYTVASLTPHPSYDNSTMDNDIAIIHTATAMAFSKLVQPANIPNADYVLADNQVVWAVGWGSISDPEPEYTEQLQHVQVWTINQEECNIRYKGIGVITVNMLCSSWLDVGGRGQCSGDSGGPLYHNGTVVGVTSGGSECGSSYKPAVSTRVSRYTSWIKTNV